jgi:peptidase C39-like protein
LTSSRRSKRAAALAAAALLLAGCAAQPLTAPQDAKAVEIADVPFFPQEKYECGPAALATVLAHAGADVDADSLVGEVYVEGLRGSLQAELLAATRRNGLIPYVLPASPDALFDELEERRPVLILQNLGIERVPVWHYAVAVGFDPADERVILRSGIEERRLEKTSRFLRSWQRGGYWGFVAVEPGELPASATPSLYVRALAGAEPLLAHEAADKAFGRALEAWPDDELVLFATAGHELAAGDAGEAAALYRRLLEQAPRHAAARNNLANALAQRGCRAEALAEARAALADVAAGDALHAAISDTVETLERTSEPAASPASCP